MTEQIRVMGMTSSERYHAAVGALTDTAIDPSSYGQYLTASCQIGT